MPIVIVHAALLLWIANTHFAPPPATRGGATLVFDVAPAPPAPPLPATPVPARLVTPPRAATASLAEPAATPIAATAPNAASEGCDLTDLVQATLRDSPAAHAALASLPANARSVANAVMLWDGTWRATDDPVTAEALARLRLIVTEVVAASSDACRIQEQAGPRLIVLPGPPDMTLALGSGRWRWGDLDGEGEASPTMMAAAATPFARATP